MRHAPILLAAALWTAAACAQETQLAPSEALACLTPPLAERGVPTYPAQEKERGDGATLLVELRFEAPDAAPRLKFLNEEWVFDGFASAVRQHVRRLRVPCMTPGKPVTLRQRYVFTPGDGRQVVVEAPTEPAQLVRQQLLECMAHTGGRSGGPPYPMLALERGLEGKVFVSVRFERSDAPPVVKRLSPRRSSPLTVAIDIHLEGLRLPCLQDEPITVNQLYVFKLDGGARTLLPPTTLLSFLQAAEHIPRPILLDLDTMGCPFDVRLKYYQPYSENTISEFGTSNPARAPLLQWLRQVRLRFGTDVAERVVGEGTTIAIPCGKVEL